jgi:hypothetical protein
MAVGKPQTVKRRQECPHEWGHGSLKGRSTAGGRTGGLKKSSGPANKFIDSSTKTGLAALKKTGLVAPQK